MSEAKRPTVTDEMIRAVILQVAPKVAGRDASEGEIEAVADSIQRVYEHPMDGFDLATALSRRECWDVTRDEADEMDAIESRISYALREAEKQWFAANPVEPPFPIGTKITRGTISGIYEYQPAYYTVKETGCTNAGRFLLIKFEDARESA